MKAKVDRETCIGIANCVAFAPTVFVLDEEKKAVVLDPSSVDQDMLIEAAKSCPVSAITIEEDDGTQVYP